jgi:hypothetical protein
MPTIFEDEIRRIADSEHPLRALDERMQEEPEGAECWFDRVTAEISEQLLRGDEATVISHLILSPEFCLF